MADTTRVLFKDVITEWELEEDIKTTATESGSDTVARIKLLMTDLKSLC